MLLSCLRRGVFTQYAVALSLCWCAIPTNASPNPHPGPTTYALDDGSGNINIGPSFAAQMLWGNYFFTQPGADIITEIQIGFGSYAVGAPVTLYLFDDPDADGDPGNAIPVSTIVGQTASTGQTGFATFALPHTQVSGAFFVAAMLPVVPPFDQPARLDPQSAGDQSWLFADGTINPTNLGASPFIVRMDQAPIPGAWMVRAIGVPAPGACSLLGLGLCVLIRRRGRTTRAQPPSTAHQPRFE